MDYESRRREYEDGARETLQEIMNQAICDAKTISRAITYLGADPYRCLAATMFTTALSAKYLELMGVKKDMIDQFLIANGSVLSSALRAYSRDVGMADVLLDSISAHMVKHGFNVKLARKPEDIMARKPGE